MNDSIDSILFKALYFKLKSKCNHFYLTAWAGERPHTWGLVQFFWVWTGPSTTQPLLSFFSQLVVSFCWQSVFLWTHCIFPPLPAEFNTFLLVFSLPSFRAVVSWPNKPVAIFFSLTHNALDRAAQPQLAYRDPQGTAKPFTCTYLTNQQIACWQGGNAERGVQFSGGQFLSSAFAFSQASFSFQGHFCSINVWSGCK